jgi:hypothetical protein
MIFTTNRRLIKQPEPPIKYVESPMMTFSNKYRRHALTQMQSGSTQNFASKTVENMSSTKSDETTNEQPKKSMKWGEPTWFLFHTLAEKIKPEYFSTIRAELLNLIYTICANLPCPNCAKHATEYLNAINFNTITTKDNLRIMLYNFHNEVNRRKKFAEFPISELTPKYSKANTINIIHHFMQFFEEKTGSLKLIADGLHRSRVALQLKAWFNKNIGCFEL